MNPFEFFDLISAGKAMYVALPDDLRAEADRGVQAHLEARVQAEKIAQQAFERQYGPGGFGHLEPHIYAAIDQSSMIRTGYRTKEEADRAAFVTGAVLSAGALVVLGGLVWRAL